MTPQSRSGVPRGWRELAPSPRQMLWGLLIAFGLMVLLVGIGYARTSIPEASSIATQQATTLYFSDGKTVLARLGSSTRVNVTLDKVPVAVQHAVLAAEDRNFYSEPGISPTGILRALWVDIRGGDIQQGGSTITQQYVKNAYLTQQRTFTRKFKEIFIATKLAHTRSKRQILEDYLNTIYFGRGASGIQAASRAYFGVDVSKLDAAQGAVLAALISSPAQYDPQAHPDAAKARWRYVLNGMVEKKWLSRGRAAAMDYPDVQDAKAVQRGSCVGPRVFICQAVRAELERHGFDRDRLEQGGFRVVTTIRRRAQAAAIAAVRAHSGGYQHSGPDRGRESALVSVQPGDGAIRAMYGGDGDCAAKRRDACTDLSGVGFAYTRSPGSSFKPYTLIAALQEGIGLNSAYPGPPQIQIGNDTIRNSEGESCGRCTLTQALAESINTIFIPLAQQVGPDHVVQAAYDAGIPQRRDLPEVPSVTLGSGEVTPLDQAVGFATIAAQGMRARPYLVARVETAQQRDVVYRATKHVERVFDADVMADTTFAMTKVLDCSSKGTACGKALPGRPAAGKTGTNGKGDNNYDAWFVGFTPQLSTAVWYGNADRRRPVTVNGAELYGGDLPAATWQQMMTVALERFPVVAFPPAAHVGTARGTVTTSTPTPTKSTSSPSPTPSTTVTVSPSVTPTLSPSPLPTASPTPTPTPTSASPPAQQSPQPAQSPPQ